MHNLSQTIKGSALDKQSEMPLIGTVQFLSVEENLGTLNDINGTFEITGVPVGRQALKVSSMGYSDLTVPIFLDFQNWTNRDNMFARRYNEVTNVITMLYQAGFFQISFTGYNFENKLKNDCSPEQR